MEITPISPILPVNKDKKPKHDFPKGQVKIEKKDQEDSSIETGIGNNLDVRV